MKQKAAPLLDSKAAEDIFENMIVDDDKMIHDEKSVILQSFATNSTTNTKQNPQINSPEWTPFILSKLEKGEMIEGNPTCDGIRRIFELYVGIILKTQMDVLQVATPENGGRATVKCTIEYYKDGILYTTSDVADCHKGNTGDPYYRHPTATAATIAEGRALRKAMRISVLLGEERSKPDAAATQEMDAEIDQKNMITSSQTAVINKIAKNSGVSIDRLLQYFVEHKKIENAILSELSSLEAQYVIRSLNEFGKSVSTPPEVLSTPKEKTAKK